MIEGHFEIDERRWREKVRQREMEIKRLKDELASRPVEAPAPDLSEYEAQIASLAKENRALAEENKAFKDKIKGLNMQIGRLKNK